MEKISLTFLGGMQIVKVQSASKTGRYCGRVTTCNKMLPSTYLESVSQIFNARLRQSRAMKTTVNN